MQGDDQQQFYGSNTGNQQRSDDGQQAQSYGNNNPNELFFWKIKAGINRNYYINVKKDKNGELYMVFKEVKTDMDSNKDVHRVMVFEKDFKKFVFGMKKCLEFINEERKHNPRPQRSYEENFTAQKPKSYSENNQQEYQPNHSIPQTKNPNYDQPQDYDLMADFDLSDEPQPTTNIDNNKPKPETSKENSEIKTSSPDNNSDDLDILLML